MANYYVNTNPQPNGDHEVHVAGCSWFPEQRHAKYLGDFAYCSGAVAAAKLIYPSADGCYYCSPSCNTR